MRDRVFTMLMVTIMVAVFTLAVLAASVEAQRFAPLNTPCPDKSGYSVIAFQERGKFLTCQYVAGGGHAYRR